MIGEDLILRFTEFNGGTATKDGLKNYHTQVQKYLDSVGTGPFVPKLSEIAKRVATAIKRMTEAGMDEVEKIELLPFETDKPNKDSIEIKKALGELTKMVKARRKTRIIRKTVYTKKRQKKRAGLKGIGESKSLQPIEKIKIDPPVKVFPPAEPKPTSLSGVTYDYYEHDLGEFQQEFHRLNSDANAMFHGQPGHGKTYKFLKLAKHFADQGKDTLYIAKEEYGRSTMREKLNELGIDDKKPYPHLKITGHLDEKDVEGSKVVFFDSVQMLKLTPEQVDALDKKYPNRTFILVVQTTKAGDYKGGKDWEHLVDVAGEVVDRQLILRKNRFDKNNAKKEAELRKQEAIKKAKDSMEIKQAVKESIKSVETPIPVSSSLPQSAAA